MLVIDADGGARVSRESLRRGDVETVDGDRLRARLELPRAGGGSASRP